MDTRQLKILYADDDLDDFVLLEEGLQQLETKHTLHFVNDTTNFIAAVKTIKPDLIFLDYNMPICDGADCLKQLKEDPELKHIPVVMYCTSSSINTLNECFKLGAVRYLLKPVDYAGIFRGLNLIFDLYYQGRLIPSHFDDFFIDTYKLN